MKRLIAYPLAEGGSVTIEVDDPDSGAVRIARPGEIAETAKQTLEDALENIKPAAQAVVSKLRGLHDEPDEITVEFGIKLNAGMGAFIATAGVEANYRVALKWAKK